MNTRTVSKLPVLSEATLKPALIYLASPYSSPDPEVKAARYNVVRSVACRLVAQGHYIYSPIVHNHPLVEYGVPPLNGGWEFWQERDLFMLEKCQELWIVEMNGWRSSVGVTAEIEKAFDLNIPVYLVNQFSLELTVIENPAVLKKLQPLPA